eukprot:gene15205-17992_t
MFPSDTLDTIHVKYEGQIESLMIQMQSCMDREKKQRLYSKSVEEAYGNLENENMKLKKENFELNKKIKDMEKELVRVAGADRQSIEGDEELVAEALGSFVEFATRAKPTLKRSSSEDSFMLERASLPSPHALLNPANNNNNNNNNNNGALGVEWNYQEDDQKLKKRRSDLSFDGNQQQSPHQQLQSKLKRTASSSNVNNHSSPNQLALFQISPTKMEHQSVADIGKAKKSHGVLSRSNSSGHFPSSMQNINAIPDLETDVDTDEFDFSRSNSTVSQNGASGSGRDDGDSPESNENSRNSSSPIEAAMTSASVFKSVASTSNTPHEALLNEVHRMQQIHRESIERLAATQKSLLVETAANGGAGNMVHRHEEIVAALQTEQKKLVTQIDSEMQALNSLYSATILEPAQLCKLDLLLQDLSIQLKQVNLFQMELSFSGPDSFPATLVITKQPFPMVISKFKQLQEDNLTVQLLTGANVDIISYSSIRAELIFHSKALAKGSGMVAHNNSLKKHIEKDTQLLDTAKGTAKFPIKFLTGTRKGCVKLHFILQIKTSEGQVINVPSSTSQPFIVITNDCQWEGSEGTLLKKESFNEKFEITWAHFVNILQKHFLKATKQSLIQPTRPLSNYDFFYLNSIFFGHRSTVSHKDFDHFWSWFGKSLQTLRYKRHISTLWQHGLIFMFLKREIVNAMLKTQEIGTFVILFSEAFPGQLEISYVGAETKQERLEANKNTNTPPTPGGANNETPDESTEPLKKTKHYLVQPNDTSGSKRTLPDFLNDCPQFSHILQLNLSSLPQHDPASNFPPFKREPKNNVLEPYYSKRQNSTTFLGAAGYDPLN